MSFLIPGLAGFFGVLVMTFFLRRARYLHLPESQMVRAIGSLITRNYETSLLPGTLVHMAMGTLFGYGYSMLLSTAPISGTNPFIGIALCSFMGLVHGMIVTLFLVIAVAQNHPLERFKSLTPEDMMSHVIAHLAYGMTVGFMFVVLPTYLG
ncbi:hypothetical protein [Acanthopleuribacter pedis]|uniref:Uncharacterized protein n=1 Tax=Acanthopleuribacter pedis TaxID=442870 RepID=A0A8J7QAW8_9BACT|nr:hypothetical protein [Acanthopleuribacter pedis]MBO1317456.1 hypothetical protein [Acanthopleuribacter pedis]